MAKKHRKDDEDFDNEDFDLDNEDMLPTKDDEKEIEEKEDDVDDIDNSVSSNLNDDDDDLNIVIEIDDDDILDIEEPSTNIDLDVKIDESDVVLSKHKVEGKHSLKYDSIFKGKKDDPVDEDNPDADLVYHRDSIEVDKSSNYYFESIDNEKYIKTKLVKEKVYGVLEEHTSINFLNNRRKPSRVDFNQYYSLLKIHLKDESFTNIELFNELSVYFSDNLFNMFKLLDKKWRNLIINELQDHIGKNVNSKEVTNRNIYEGTEIEFQWFDDFSSSLLTITGDVVEVDYDNSRFKVNSYEKVYDISILDITKILNNTKFKYNLNKLNNIDFL